MQTDLIPDMAAQRAALSGSDTAFRDSRTGRAWTFEQVNAAADGVAAGLERAGLHSGDRIGVLCLNQTMFFVLLFACQKTGVILCPLNWRQTAGELAAALAVITPRAIVHDWAHAGLAADIAAPEGCSLLSFETDLAAWADTVAPARRSTIPEHRPWYLLFTSGTTGQPKAVIYTARMAWANTMNAALAVSLTASDRSVSFLPLFHTAGINLYTLPLFLHGGSSIILPKFEPADVLALLRAGEVTQFFGVPAIYRAFSLSQDLDRIDWASIRFGCGGAPLPAPLIEFFARRGALVLNGFGLTESGPTVFLMDTRRARDKIGSVGRPQMLTDMRLGHDDAPDMGEIQLRGPNITPGYFNNAEATAQTFTADGWLRTGDIGRRDADGYMFVVDRVKDMYISGGENVFPAEIEAVLHTHPSILESAVIGMPDSRWGEVGAAFVVLRPGQLLDPATLTAWCRNRLAAYKVPARFETVEDFPRTAAGKIRKPLLREQLEWP